MSDVEDFSLHPKSLTEIKGEKSSNAREWAPRDALISCLRDIDSGEIKAASIIVCVKCEPSDVLYYNATPNVVSAIGLLEYTKHLMLKK